MFKQEKQCVIRCSCNRYQVQNSNGREAIDQLSVWVIPKNTSIIAINPMFKLEVPVFFMIFGHTEFAVCPRIGVVSLSEPSPTGENNGMTSFNYRSQLRLSLLCQERSLPNSHVFIYTTRVLIKGLESIHSKMAGKERDH